MFQSSLLHHYVPLVHIFCSCGMLQSSTTPNVSVLPQRATPAQHLHRFALTCAHRNARGVCMLTSRIMWQGAWRSKLVARLLGWAVLGRARLLCRRLRKLGCFAACCWNRRLPSHKENGLAASTCSRIGGLVALWWALKMGPPRGTKQTQFFQ